MLDWFKKLRSSHPGNNVSKKEVACTADQGSADDAKKKGDSFLRQGNLEEAAAAYRQAIRQNQGYAEAHLNLGYVLMQQKNLDEAKNRLQQALALNRQLFDAYYLLGNIAKTEGKTGEAITHYQRAIQLKPDFETVYPELCQLLFESGQTEAAMHTIQQGISYCPHIARFYFILGDLHDYRKEYAQAEQCFATVVSLQPDFARAYRQLGIAQHRQKKLEEAAESYQKALQIEPDDAVIHNNLGAIFEAQDHFSVAKELYEKALAIDPECVEALSNLGGLQMKTGAPEKALASLRLALEIQPDYAIAHNNLGNVFQNIGQYEDALACYRQALAINPDYAQVHNNISRVFYSLGRYEEGLTSCQRALALDPNDADTLNNLGNYLQESGRFDEALNSYQRALQIKPDFAMAFSNLLFIHNYLLDQPPAQMLAEAQRFGELVASKAHPFSAWDTLPDPGRCLRIGLVSADLRTHPVGYFLENVLSALASTSAGRLEIIAYYNHFAVDALTERLRACCHAWHPVVGLPDETLARQIHADRIDILIDLSGHTAQNRLPMFAWKPAPIQTTWLGYFATTGVSAIDYLIADPYTLPESEERHFSETIWRLPETRLCFTPPAENIEVSPLPALQNGYVTFGCFNSLAKMNDAVVELWAQILTAVPDSKLFLKARQIQEASTQELIFTRYAAHGIGRERLILEGLSPRADYLATYRRVDIALDPFPYTGGTTSAEALWMGVPVLTLAGPRFLSRQGVGLLMNAGLPDWVAQNPEDYVARAAAHAKDVHNLSALRNRLRQQVLASPIFDAPRFAQHFESALRNMWQKWCAQEPAGLANNSSNSAMV